MSVAIGTVAVVLNSAAGSIREVLLALHSFVFGLESFQLFVRLAKFGVEVLELFFSCFDLVFPGRGSEHEWSDVRRVRSSLLFNRPGQVRG